MKNLKEDKSLRLANALRDNLKKRKAQARASAKADTGVSGSSQVSSDRQ
jgi:hypothetical protein